jgi:hypothetical protein
MKLNCKTCTIKPWACAACNKKKVVKKPVVTDGPLCSKCGKEPVFAIGLGHTCYFRQYREKKKAQATEDLKRLLLELEKAIHLLLKLDCKQIAEKEVDEFFKKVKKA